MKSNTESQLLSKSLKCGCAVAMAIATMLYADNALASGVYTAYGSDIGICAVAQASCNGLADDGPGTSLSAGTITEETYNGQVSVNMSACFAAFNDCKSHYSYDASSPTKRRYTFSATLEY